MTDYNQHITINVAVRSGQPCINGTRITVGDILSYLASGMSHDEIIIDFPSLSNQHIFAALAFAAEAQKRTATLDSAA